LDLVGGEALLNKSIHHGLFLRIRAALWRAWPIAGSNWQGDPALRGDPVPGPECLAILSASGAGSPPLARDLKSLAAEDKVRKL
jgi:hypothetical protein